MKKSFAPLAALSVCALSGCFPPGPTLTYATIAVAINRGVGAADLPPVCGTASETVRLTLVTAVGKDGTGGPYTWTDSESGIVSGDSTDWICSFNDVAHVADPHLVTGTWLVSASAGGWGASCKRPLGAGVNSVGFTFGSPTC